MNILKCLNSKQSHLPAHQNYSTLNPLLSRSSYQHVPRQKIPKPDEQERNFEVDLKFIAFLSPDGKAFN